MNVARRRARGSGRGPIAAHLDEVELLFGSGHGTPASAGAVSRALSDKEHGFALGRDGTHGGLGAFGGFRKRRNLLLRNAPLPVRVAPNTQRVPLWPP